MYSNFTTVTAGELSSRMGILNSTPQDMISGSNFTNLDELRLTASQNKVQYLLDLVPLEKIAFARFTPEENGFISLLHYSNTGTILSIVNADSSTMSIKRDDQSIRFGDTIDGHIALLHAMLRYAFITTTPNDTILGHAHNIFTTILYTLIIRLFNRDFSIFNMTEEYRAAIRYACACISASKHFQLTCPINDVAIPMTHMVFNRVSPSFYSTDNNITTYDSFMAYLNEKVGITVDKPTFINGVIRTLQYRALVILECGIDFIIDCLLSKTSAKILSRNLYKILGIQQYANIHSKIGNSFYQQVSLNIPA